MDPLREMMLRVVGPLTSVGDDGHVAPTAAVPLCECRDCPPHWCDGSGPAYRRERIRKGSRWVGERDVCSRCTQAAPIFEHIEYPDADGIMRTAHVRWLIEPGSDLAPYRTWDKDFDGFYPLCECGCPRYMHRGFYENGATLGACHTHNGESDFVRRHPVPHCTAWRERVDRERA